MKNLFARSLSDMCRGKHLLLVSIFFSALILPIYGDEAKPTPTPAVQKPDEIPTVEVTLSSDKEDLGVRFNWGSIKPALAVIEETHDPKIAQYWLVFDHKADLVLPDLQEKPIPAIKSIEKIPANEAVVLKIVVDSFQSPVISQEGNQWDVHFKSNGTSILKMASIKLPKTKGEGVTVNLESAGKEVRFIDPYSGFTYAVYPTHEIGFGVAQERGFPEFLLKESPQGLCFVLQKDGVLTQVTTHEVSLNHGDGLAISLPREQEANPINVTPIGFFADAQDLDWAGRRHKINEFLLDYPHDQHAAGELEIAWLLLSYGQSAEALGYLTHLSQERPSIVNIPLFQLLQGIGHTLLNQLSLGEAHLWHCRGEPEAHIWLSLTEVLQHPQYFKTNTSLLAQFKHEIQCAKEMAKSYPKPLRIQLTTLILMTGIALQDTEIINTILDQETRPENINAGEVYDLARARLLMNQSKQDAAFQILGELMEKASSPIVQSIARFDYVRNRFEGKLMGAEDVFSQLESLRTQWHGNWLASQVGSYLNSIRNQRNTTVTSHNQTAAS
jgi:hypothetical protein